MITLQDVSKSFRAKRERIVILDDVTLELPHANIGLIGASGSGKSTLLNLICGNGMPDHGQIEREGMVSWPLGFRGGFSKRMTGAENVRFVARIYGQDTDAIIDYVRDFADLGRYFDLPLENYSGSMRNQLAFGACMAIGFDIYLVDEIFTKGDSRFRDKCSATLGTKLETSRLIMTSEDMTDLREYCQSGLVLYDGGLTYYADLEEAITAFQELEVD